METKQTPEQSEPETSIERWEHEMEDLEGVGKKKWGWWLGGIIVVGAVAAVLILVRAPERAPGVSSLASLALLELHEPRPGRLKAPPSFFSWESVSGRQTYQFRLAEKGSSTPLVERAVTQSSIQLTSEEAGLLVPGKSYVWQVEARAKGGAKLAAAQSAFDL